MPLVPHPPPSTRDQAGEGAVSGLRSGSGGNRLGSGGSGGGGRPRGSGGDVSSAYAAQQKAGLPALNFSKLKADYAAAGLDGTLSSRATAAAAGLQIPSSTAGGGGGTARVAGRPYQLGGPGPSAPSGGGPQAPAGGHAKPPLSKEQANPAFARRVVPAAGAAGLQPHPPDAGPRVGSGGPQASGQSGAQGSSGTAARDPLPDRNKQEIMQPLTARATGTGKWEDGVNGPAAKQPLTSRPVGKDEVQVKPTRYEDAIKGSPSGGSNVPLTPAAALKLYMQHMTLYEQGEILDYPQVYYVGVNAQKARATADAADNHGFDDERGDYQWVNQDHIAFRYQILGVLGKGSFGVVIKSFDWKTNQLVALKIIRNMKRFHHQALVEVKLLEHLRDNDTDGSAAIVTMYDYFYFRNHMCITFEMLCINLYEFIKNNKFQGLSLGLIRRIAVQLLLSLRFLSKLRVIHCDLKPENILLKAPNKSSIKVIDFGSSCFENERVYTYIQSRFYRSPEVIMGLPYDMAIDMWSFGCILAELYTGYPIFPGENEVEQLACIMEVMDLPPKHIIEQASRKKMFFDSTGAPRIVANSRGKKRRPGSKDVATALRCNDAAFVSFLEGCLQWDKKERCNPEQALKHEWITEAAIPSSQYRASPAYDGPKASSTRATSGGGVGVTGSQTARGSVGAIPPKKIPDAKRAAAGYLTFRDRHLFPPIDPSVAAKPPASARGAVPKAGVGSLRGGI